MKIGLACVALVLGLSLPVLSQGEGSEFVIVKPEDVRWQPVPNGGGLQTAVIYGDPNKPGPYVIRVKFPPGLMTRPHTHPEERFAVVLQGTWWVGTGSEFEPSKATPLKPGSFMKHPANERHYDGAKDEEVIVQIVGIGPTGTTLVNPAAGMTGKSR